METASNLAQAQAVVDLVSRPVSGDALGDWIVFMVIAVGIFCLVMKKLVG